MRSNTGWMCRPEAVQGVLDRENSGCGRGRLNIRSAGLTGRSRGAGAPLLFCSALFDTTNIWPRAAPQARYTRLARCPAAPRHGPGGPWQRTARQFARYGPGWRGGSSAGQPPKHPRWTVAMGARAGSPRRTALISAFSRDGTDQRVVVTDSSKKGAFRKARAPPRQRSARPVCSTR